MWRTTTDATYRTASKCSKWSKDVLQETQRIIGRPTVNRLGEVSVEPAAHETAVGHPVPPENTPLPLFMDRHNAPDATYEALAEAHRLDLELQEQYDVRFLAYWFDPHRELAFCLANAPTAEAMKEVHAASHGAIPSDIRKVDLEEVVAFLGRATEPDQGDPAAEDFRPDSAFRTILFTDMIDSTPLTMHLGDAEAVALLERHDRAISTATTSYGGRIVKHTGDGFMISFNDVDSALHASIRIQNDISVLHELLSIRVGINAGNPIERGDDLFGMTVQLTARVCEHAEAGQILVSGILHELCSDSRFADRFIDRGRIQMKGFQSALQVYELDWRSRCSSSVSKRDI